ncbi:MAG: hypothetical protein U0796_19165 [Gemmatales bacterium]
MNLCKLLLLAMLFSLGQTSLHAQADAKGDAKQKAYEAMVAAEKQFNLADFNVKAILGRRVVPGQINQGRSAVIVPTVPHSMYDQREEAWKRFQQAAATYHQLAGSIANESNPAVAADKVRGTAQSKMAPAQFAVWLEGHSVDLNDQAVKARLMNCIQSDGWEAAQTLYFLIQQGPQAISYRDDLMAFVKSEALQKRRATIRIQVVAALVRMDPSTKQELIHVTKNWFPNQQSNIDRTYRRNLNKALDGEINQNSKMSQAAAKKDVGSGNNHASKR